MVVPLLQTDNLSRRIKAVGAERERIRLRERERLAASQNNGRSCASKPSDLLKQLVDSLNLTSWLSTETAKETLAQAGFRGAGAEYAFLTFRLVAPIVFALVAAVYVFFIAQLELSRSRSSSASSWRRSYLGVKAPETLPAQHDDQAAEVRSSAPIPTRSTSC